MNRKDIDRLFTEQVTGLLAQGYQIHTSTMGGSQGEIEHIDLTNGSEILRVLIEIESSYGEAYGDIVRITVGRNTDPVRRNWHEIIWNNRLEIRSQIELAKITDNYFVTPEAAKPMAQKWYERWMHNGSRYDFTVATRALGDAYKSIALRWLRRQPRMKTCRLEDIERMVKMEHRDGSSRYEITVRGKTYMLRSRNIEMPNQPA